MSDTDPKTPNKTGASGAAWSEGEKNAPIPVGRSVISCKKLLVRLKEKHKDDIVKIKNGQAFAPAASTATDVSPEKPKAKATPKKRKSKLDLEANDDGNGGDGGEADGSPKKKATPRGRKKKVEVKEEVKEEEMLEEEA
ncbi:hypothetical protein J4E93_006152 [Alternaria ventricosa]|uniref:uncharacterized protein n=1 Tax=Alternaria ventricosa TaxID=1187951 RepID=UPI0020C301CC|nr:uncharacterized protein J4E93_006152 [Alternaria ventricosa]KAI4644252.1 hypothetical protein J4E93_006152 [Alternaria ventricosa]